MKKVFLFLLIIVSILVARDNPFASTQEFEEEKNRLAEKFSLDFVVDDIVEDDQNIYVDESFNAKKEEANKLVEIPKKERSQERVEKLFEEVEVKKIEEKEIEKQAEIKQEVKDESKENIKLTKPEVKEEIKITTPNIQLKNEPLNIKTGLKFVTILAYDDKIEINSPYKVFKKLNLLKDRKIVFDFRADLNFSTKRIDLDHKYFKQVAIGNHKKDGYFRVVVELKEPIKKFDATYTDTKVVVKYK